MKIWVLRFRNKTLIECYDLFPVLPALLKILLASEYLPIPLHPTFLLQLLPPVHLLEHHLVKEGGVVPHQQWHHQEPHLQYGAHHGAGGCVADEHGYETGDCHKAGGGGNQTFSYSMASLLREASFYQNRWIFSVAENDFWPPLLPSLPWQLFTYPWF